MSDNFPLVPPIDLRVRSFFNVVHNNFVVRPKCTRYVTSSTSTSTRLHNQHRIQEVGGLVYISFQWKKIFGPPPHSSLLLCKRTTIRPTMDLNTYDSSTKHTIRTKPIVSATLTLNYPLPDLITGTCPPPFEPHSTTCQPASTLLLNI